MSMIEMIQMIQMIGMFVLNVGRTCGHGRGPSGLMQTGQDQ